MPQSLLEKETEEGEDDVSDYCEDDFKDLLSKKEIQQSIQGIYSRLLELTNPIDEKRLKMDSVHQVKQTVRQFYKRKNY